MVSLCAGPVGRMYPGDGAAGPFSTSPPKNFRLEGRLLQAANFLHGWPEVAQVHIFTPPLLTDRLAGEIDVHISGQSKRDDERRTHQKIRLHALVNARFEIAIAGKH